jgi:hypothetical protein
MKPFPEITASLESYIARVEKRLERSKSVLLQKLGEGCEMRQVIPSIMDVAKAEGALAAAKTLLRDFKTYGDGGVLEAVVDLATEQVDDAWSGRGNDVMRAMHDGRLETLNHVKKSLFGHL